VLRNKIPSQTARLDRGSSALSSYHIYHLLPPFLPTCTSIPPNSQNLKMQENWKWLGARKP